jgi:hypothetical protein
MNLTFVACYVATGQRPRLTGGDGLEIERAHLGGPSTRWGTIMGSSANAVHREPWNKGKIVGQKAPFKPNDIWALRVRLQMEGQVRDLALFNLGIDSKLRGCGLVALKVRDICHGEQVAARAFVMQHKTQRPVQSEVTAATRDAVEKWIKIAGLKSDDSAVRAGRPCRRQRVRVEPWCRTATD